MILYILNVEQFKESEYVKDVPKQKVHHQAGQYLLRFALGEDAYARAEFAVGEHGKPYIVGYPIHYNISHSGKFVVLVVSECDVGADVQECKQTRVEALAKRFFTKQEQEAIHTCDSEDSDATIRQERIFYKIWCRKEAYGKYLGVGLNELVLSTNVLDEASDIRFHDLSFIEGCQLCICSRKGENIEKIISVFEGL